MSTNNETKWLLRALVTLAKRHLAEANATPEVQDGNWPAGQEWHELGHTSQHAFMHRAREESGIPHSEYRDLIEAATMDSDELDTIWQELERPNVNWAAWWMKYLDDDSHPRKQLCLVRIAILQMLNNLR